VTAYTSTSAIASGLNVLATANWAEISDLIEGKDTLQKGLTTVEDVAGTLVGALTVAGVPFAGTVQTFLPLAEKLVGIGEEILSAAGGSASPVVTAANKATAAPASASS
jgi:hypothetical protein